MQIVVSDPLTEGSFLKKFTTYQVMSHVAVRRRYSDFEWLLTALRSRFVGMLLPALPEKKAIKTDDSVIRSRVRGLNLFLSTLVANEYVQTDPDLRSFLTLSDSGAWENAKRQHVDHALHDPSAGLLKWREMLERSELPANLDRVVVEMKQKSRRRTSWLLRCVLSIGWPWRTRCCFGRRAFR